MLCLWVSGLGYCGCCLGGLILGFGVCAVVGLVCVCLCFGFVGLGFILFVGVCGGYCSVVLIGLSLLRGCWVFVM